MKSPKKTGSCTEKLVKSSKNPAKDPNPLSPKCPGANKDQPNIGYYHVGHSRTAPYYAGGKIMAPDNGKVYSCTIKVIAGGKRLECRLHRHFARRPLAVLC